MLSLGDDVNGSLRNSTGDITVASGATFDFSQFFTGSINNLTNALILNGTGSGTGAGSTIGAEAFNIRNNSTASGTITLASAATITHNFNNATLSGTIVTGGNALTLKTTQAGQPGLLVSGAITGSGALTVTGAANTAGSAGTSIDTWSVKLSGNNTFTGGLTITNGTVVLANAGALNSTAGSENAVTFSAGTTTGNLTLGGTSVVVANLTSNATPGTPVVQNASTSTARLTIGNSQNFSGTYAGVLQDGTPAYGSATALALTKAGTGSLTLTGTNTYTGGTNLTAGTLNFTTGGLGTTGVVTFTGNSTLQFGTSTTTDLSSRLAIGNGLTGTVDTNGNNVTFATDFGASGSGALTKAGTGTLSLNAANTYTGLTTVTAGTLAVGSGGSLASGNALTLGASGLATFANAGQTLGAVTNANTTSNALNFSAASGTVTLGSLSGAGNTTFGSNGTVTGGISAGTVNATGNLTANISGGTTTVGGLLTGNISAGTVGAGSLSATTVSGGTNTIIGAAGITTLSSGTTTVGGVATIGTLSGGTANLNGATSAITTLNGGTVNLGSSTVLTVSDGTTFGVIAGTGGSLTKSGSSTLTFNSANTYTGLTTVSAGTLAIGSSGSLASASALTLGASGLATFANAGQILGAVTNANTTTHALNFSAATGTVTLANLSGVGNTRFGSNGVVTGGISAGTVTSVGNLTANISGGTTTVGGLLTGNISAATVGAGSLSAITVSGGTATITEAAGITTLSSGTTTVGGVATIGTLSGGTANLNGSTNAVTTLSGGMVNLGSASALTVSGGTSAGVITGTGGSFTKIGSGMLTLTGANTYSGTTTVSAGTLALNTSGTAALANTSAVVVGSGATVSLGAANQINAAASLTLNGGTVALNGFIQTLGTLDLNASSALNLSGSAALVFADSSGLNWNSALLSISNFSITTNSLRFGLTGTGLDATQLGLIRFVEFGNSAARIDAGGFLAPINLNYSNTGATDLVISSAITGTTTVTQSGTGTTTLTGANTSTGLATVTNSILVIGTAVGGNWAGNVTVGSSGILKGRGDIAGLVIVNPVGTFSPGNSPAIQHIGALTVNSGGSLTIELDGPTAGTGSGFHDQVISAGAVTLNGGTLNGQTIFSGSSGYLPTIGAVHVVITGSAVTGKFDTYDFSANPAGLSFLPEYTATSVNLYAVPSNYSTAVAGLNANQTQVGTALQSLRNSGLPLVIDQRTTLDARSTLFNGLKTKNAAGLRTAFDQLTPEKLTVLAAATFQSASILNSALVQRSAELRRFGPASISLNGVATPAAAEDYRVKTVIEDGVQYQISKAKPKKHYGYFATATGALAAVDGSSERLGSFSQTGAATAGVDYALNENQSVGLVVGQAMADTDFSSKSGTARTTTSRVGVFHDYHNGGYYVNSSVSAGFSAYDIQRKIAFLNQTAQGETQGFSYGGQLASGYDFNVGNFILGPTASVAYDHAHINGFEETGSAADLIVRRQNADSLITKFGVHVSRPFVAKKIGWVPDLSLSASRQSFNPNKITAQLAAGGDTFKVKPQAGGSEYINPGASLAALLPNGWSVRLSYDAILNPQSADHRVNLSFGAGF